ncbi:MAG: hypothetical protein HY821_23015 [Acidobacteria bacterium]|nr:hypothetical protein [Acidobacteriota bacterium]
MNPEGKCPEVEALERFWLGQSTAEEAEELRAHLEQCGVCSLALERLLEWEPAVKQASMAEPDWKAMEQRLGLAAAPEQGKMNWWRWLAQQPAWGYALAVILAYPAWLGVGGGFSRPGGSESGAKWVKAVDLNPTRAPGALPKVDSEVVALEFLVAEQPDDSRRVEIRNAEGQVAVRLGRLQQCSETGNCVLVVNAGQLKAGRYALVVQAKEEQGSEEVFEFERR